MFVVQKDTIMRTAVVPCPLEQRGMKKEAIATGSLEHVLQMLMQQQTNNYCSDDDDDEDGGHHSQGQANDIDHSQC